MTVNIENVGDRWCPFARRLAGGDDAVAGINRRPNFKPNETAPCLGPVCMAWRWTNDDGAFGAQASDTEGYCGLAGGPV